MTPYQNYDFTLYLDENCVICQSQYKKADTKDFLSKLQINDYPPTLLDICPTCIAKVYLESLDAASKTNKDLNTINKTPSRPNPVFQKPQNTTPAIDMTGNPAVKIPELNSFTKKMAVIFGVVSILILVYSLLLKYLPQLNLPNFPFYPYVVVFSFLAFFLKYKGAELLFLIVIVLNFFSPHFRNLFYSHFESPWTKIVFTLFFVNSFVSLLNLFFVYFRNSFLPKYGTVYQSQFIGAMYKAFIPTFFLYGAVMSPFLLGAIKPGGDPSIKVDKIQIDPIFDALTTLTKETADVEIARQYFNEGKESASLGTTESLNRSIQFYQMAIELVPKFSTAYVEMGYSYGSIYRIKKSINRKDEESKTYLNKARVSLDAAKTQNAGNYTIYAVESILDFLSGNTKAAEANLTKAIEMTGSGGTNERLLLAMALNEKSEVESLNYLITIKDKINPNSAELFNMLAIKYFKVGNMEKAKESAERALLLSPRFDEPYFNLALVVKERSEKESIFNKIIEMKSDYASKAENFKDLLKWQFAMKIAFWVLFPIMFFRFFYLAYQVALKKIQPQKLQFNLINNILLFTVIFGSFELYIHFINPVNSLTHIFPTSFPIF